MKHLKTYENNDTPYNIGEFVIVKLDNHTQTGKKIMKEVGEIINKANFQYTVRYFNINGKLVFDIKIYLYQIIDHSKNKEDLEIKLATNKYNL